MSVKKRSFYFKGERFDCQILEEQITIENETLSKAFLTGNDKKNLLQLDRNNLFWLMGGVFLGKYEENKKPEKKDKPKLTRIIKEDKSKNFELF